jgi:hypothetical protein
MVVSARTPITMPEIVSALRSLRREMLRKIVPAAGLWALSR